MSKSIKFKIDKQGGVTMLDACGMGTSCTATTDRIGELLGEIDQDSREFTDSYNQLPDEELHIDDSQT